MKTIGRGRFCYYYYFVFCFIIYSLVRRGHDGKHPKSYLLKFDLSIHLRSLSIVVYAIIVQCNIKTITEFLLSASYISSVFDVYVYLFFFLRRRSFVHICDRFNTYYNRCNLRTQLVIALYVSNIRCNSKTHVFKYIKCLKCLFGIRHELYDIRYNPVHYIALSEC